MELLKKVKRCNLSYIRGTLRNIVLQRILIEQYFGAVLL